VYQHQFHERLRLMARAMGMAGLAASTAFIIAACGGPAGGTKSSPLGLIDVNARTVQFDLFITQSSFNGYSGGGMTMRVPEGWRVDVYCNNQTSTPQSCAFVSGAGSTTPAFAGAASPDPVVGLRPGTSWFFAFTPKTVGSYRLASLSPSHGDGIWDRFDVVATGRPSVSTSDQPALNSPRAIQARRTS